MFFRERFRCPRLAFAAVRHRRLPFLLLLAFLAAPLLFASRSASAAAAQAVPPPSGAGAPGVGQAGIISPGDTIRVLVVGESLMSGDQLVDANGRITLPMAGQLKVGNLTTAQAAVVIGNALRQKRILRRPQVSVYLMAQENPRAFTIVGGVNAPGSYPLQNRTTLLQAVAKARGPVEGARKHQVEVTRTEADGQVRKAVYDLNKPEVAAVEIRPGDYVFMPYGKRKPDTLGLISGAAGLFLLLRQL